MSYNHNQKVKYCRAALSTRATKLITGVCGWVAGRDPVLQSQRGSPPSSSPACLFALCLFLSFSPRSPTSPDTNGKSRRRRGNIIETCVRFSRLQTVLKRTKMHDTLPLGRWHAVALPASAGGTLWAVREARALPTKCIMGHTVELRAFVCVFTDVKVTGCGHVSRSRSCLQSLWCDLIWHLLFAEGNPSDADVLLDKRSSVRGIRSALR